MRKIRIKIAIFLKGLTLLMRPHIFLGWLRHPLLTTANTIQLSKWISSQDKSDILNDFYSGKRNHSKRYELYQYLVDKHGIKDEPMDYLEFGVCGANSFKWWLNSCDNPDNRFYGFDTFEGLPENWGGYSKGDMSAELPDLGDSRAKFIKGLFQDTLSDFLSEHDLNNGKRRIIHLDADLFTSTLFVLTSLAPYIRKGDILIFDEFNVPNHEFFAFKIFSDSFYVKTKLLGAVNNYYQVALIVE